MGEAVPKPRPKGVGDGSQVNIPVLPRMALKRAGTEKDRSSTVHGSVSKPVGCSARTREGQTAEH
jgi:hypothetical protein